MLSRKCRASASSVLLCIGSGGRCVATKMSLHDIRRKGGRRFRAGAAFRRARRGFPGGRLGIGCTGSAKVVTLGRIFGRHGARLVNRNRLLGDTRGCWRGGNGRFVLGTKLLCKQARKITRMH